MKKGTLITGILLLMMGGIELSAQSIGINTNTPDPSSVLDIVSGTAGMLPPRLTTAQRDAISNPAEGLFLYNTDSGCLNFRSGGAWQKMCGDGNLDFELGVSPGSLSIDVGSNNSGSPVTLSITHLSGDVLPVGIGISGLPSGVTHTLSSAGGFPDFSSSLVFTVSGGATPGTYNVIITATGGGDTEVDTFSLAINTPPLTEYRVFATSATYQGNLGGLGGADATCQSHADGASLGGTWKAFMSSSFVSADSRLVHATAPYKRIDGNTIANSWADLTDGSDLSNAITIDEFGTMISNNGVWTGTTNTGAIITPTCSDWTTNSNSVNGRGGHTDQGSAGLWTGSNDWTCDLYRRLYCFEQ